MTPHRHAAATTLAFVVATAIPVSAQAGTPEARNEGLGPLTLGMDDIVMSGTTED